MKLEKEDWELLVKYGLAKRSKNGVYQPLQPGTGMKHLLTLLRRMEAAI